MLTLYPAVLPNSLIATQDKERTSTLCDSMNGIGEHYAKWNKPGSKRQITWEEPNKQNKQASKKEQETRKQGTNWQ